MSLGPHKSLPLRPLSSPQQGKIKPPCRSCGLALSAGFFGGERLPVLPPGEVGPGTGRRMRGHTAIPYRTQRVMDMHSARATTCGCGSGPPCSLPHSAALPPHTPAQHTDTWCKHASRQHGLAYALCSGGQAAWVPPLVPLLQAGSATARSHTSASLDAPVCTMGCIRA